MNVLNALIEQRSKYIVLVSTPCEEPVVDMITTLAHEMNGIVLNYMHLDENGNFEKMHENVEQVYEQKKPIFILAKSFPMDKINLPANFHIHVSNPKIKEEPDSLKSNKINKYINLKKDSDIDAFTTIIFNNIIENVERKLYGDNYETFKTHF